MRPSLRFWTAARTSGPVLDLPAPSGIVAPASPQTQTAPPQRPVLLLADDERDILGLLAFLFHQAGFEVHTADDGIEAVARAKEVRPDIALLNNMMPRRSGIAACAAMNGMPALDGLPKVVYSACHLASFRPAALAAGARACWETPMTAADFLRRTKAVLHGRERDPASLPGA